MIWTHDEPVGVNSHDWYWVKTIYRLKAAEPALVHFEDSHPKTVRLGDQFLPATKVIEWGPRIPNPDEEGAVEGTLQEARNLVKEGRGKGLKCPCCDQYAKVYRRTINSTMARWLIWLVKEYHVSKDWVDVRTSPVRGGDYAKLGYWGLTENRTNDDEKKRTSGLWIPTQSGRSFVRNQVTVPRYASVYDGHPIDFSVEQISIIDALGKHFDYKELMR